MTTDENKALVRQLLEDLNLDQLDLVDDVVANDYQQDNPSVPGGKEGLKALFVRLRSAFPDLSVSIDQLVAEDDAVVAVTTMTGTQRGELPGIPATGKKVKVSSIDI